MADLVDSEELAREEAELNPSSGATDAADAADAALDVISHGGSSAAFEKVTELEQELSDLKTRFTTVEESISNIAKAMQQLGRDFTRSQEPSSQSPPLIPPSIPARGTDPPRARDGVDDLFGQN